ncbi:magnesium/cobalt transporter CorA [bacterium]|nr:magnesium/cobalt transporter CorA [bacterium]
MSRARPKTRRSLKTGLPPGTPVFVGEKKTEKVHIHYFDYNENQYVEKDAETVEECFPYRDKPSVTWINIDGLDNLEILQKIGDHFGVHPLVREDIVNTEQRPKLEDFGDYLLIVLKMLTLPNEAREIDVEQVSLLVGKNFVISFQERDDGDVFSVIRDRIRKNQGVIRKMGPDFLAYALIDAIVDHYFIILEISGEQLEGMEDTLIQDPSPEILQKLYALKRRLLFLRKSVWPLREVLGNLSREDAQMVKKHSRVYFKDINDHTVQILDNVETLRDMTAGLIDIYLSSISAKLNEVMKVLTIISTIFIPLSFIAGIYGMNFHFMPELNWHYGYAIVWVLMILVVMAMLFFFRKKKWI